MPPGGRGCVSCPPGGSGCFGVPSMASQKLEIIPLGGATEIGKNITAYRLGDEILVADCGLMFPDSSQLGVDLLIPDVSYLQENQDKVLGIVLTHGHEDHIGALPYVLKQLPVPIWATRLTLGLIRKKLHEHGLWADTDWHLAEDGERVRIGSFEVEFVHVNHSVPDAASIILRPRHPTARRKCGSHGRLQSRSDSG